MKREGKMRYLKLCIAVAVIVAVAGTAQAVTVTVPGTATVYFAGQDAASITAAKPVSGYSSPHNIFHSDGATSLPPSLDITGFIGGPIDISATGLWGYGPSNQEGPAGGTWGSGTSHAEYGVFGISRLVNGPWNSLVGVFLTDAAPSTSAPGSLTYGVSDMTTPGLQQEFHIGSGLNDISAPTGATRLFFGLHNGYGWYNNAGSVDVSVIGIPEPLTMLGVFAGIAGIGAYIRKRRRA